MVELIWRVLGFGRVIACFFFFFFAFFFSVVLFQYPLESVRASVRTAGLPACLVVVLAVLLFIVSFCFVLSVFYSAHGHPALRSLACSCGGLDIFMLHAWFSFRAAMMDVNFADNRSIMLDSVDLGLWPRFVLCKPGCSRNSSRSGSGSGSHRCRLDDSLARHQ